jgi:glycerol kinase
MTFILAIDQGTTSSRAIVFDENMNPVKTAQKEFTQIYPQSGWVEHDAEEIWQSVETVVAQAREGFEISAVGITNQRETVVVWDKDTGAPVHNAIVWQDRRTSALCEKLKSEGQEELVTQTTGLLLDPYFSATKLAWILDNVEGVRARAEKGELRFGTIDSFLIWRLTGGKVHATDATNAARTMLYDIHMGRWSDELCRLLDIPMSILPEVKDCADDFGIAQDIGAPILGVAGDQQAATIGQACFAPGMMKSTYGTGCFALLNTGERPVRSSNRLLTTIAYQLDGKPTYALEGSIFIAGAVVQWLRDGLKIIDDASATQAMAEAADDTQDLIIVPAFTGLGAPYWNAECRGAVFGLTRNSGPNEFAKAALRSVGFQTRDLLEAMRADWPDAKAGALRVDGGMSASDFTMQFLADVCGVDVDRPKILETTALGVAWLAGMRAGVYPSMDDFANTWVSDKSFAPQMNVDESYAKWKHAVDAVTKV